MEKLSELENKIINDYVESIIKQVDGAFNTIQFKFPYEIKIRIMNILTKHIITTGDNITIRFKVNYVSFREEMRPIVKKSAIDLFISKVDKQNEKS